MSELPASASLPARRFDFRVAITGALMAALSAMFWIGSRYPSLQGKASADPNEALSTPLGFERFFPEPPAGERLRHVAWTSVEWALTNRQGMTFGLLLAAGMLTLIPLLRRARGGKLAGAIQGMLVGTPLGVCVNCAAPIAQGMLKGGSRVDVALATLFSSPTFNVIVLGIVLSMFPWYLALLKILAGLVTVLLVVPWLARLAERPGWTRPAPAVAKLPGVRWFQRVESMIGTPALSGSAVPEPAGFFRSAAWVVLHYPRNLWRVTVVALPLMLVAGVAGAVLASVPAPPPQHPALPIGLSAAELRSLARPQPSATKVVSSGDVELWYTPFEPTGARAPKDFSRIDGSLLGFKRLPLPRPYQSMQPGPMHLGPLAAGDVNDDGWPDVAVGTPYGVFLYVNLGGKFALQQLDFPEMREWAICDVALVDLDGDGALDL